MPPVHYYARLLGTSTPDSALKVGVRAQHRVELAVHLEDLALSVGVHAPAPEAALAIAIDVLVAAARERHGDQAVLHALARRERDTNHALRVL